MAIQVYCPNCKQKIAIDSLHHEIYWCWFCMSSFEPGNANLVYASDEDPPGRHLPKGS